MDDFECISFARALVNNVSLLSGKTLIPTNQDLIKLCICLDVSNIVYNNRNMDIILHNWRDLPGRTQSELLRVFRDIKIIT